MAHNHIDTRVRLPESCKSCKVLWDILGKEFPEVSLDLEEARRIGEESGDSEMFNFLTRKVDSLNIMKWQRDRYQ